MKFGYSGPTPKPVISSAAIVRTLLPETSSVVCDTHCIRICNLLGLASGKEPEKVERQLRERIPPKESNNFCHRMVLFGRDTCTARSPKCEGCPLAKDCDTAKAARRG